MIDFTKLSSTRPKAIHDRYDDPFDDYGPKPDNFDSDLEALYQDSRISKTAKGRIWDKYHYQAVTRIKEDPYQLITHIRGVGFTIADHIAKNVGIRETDWKRIQAAIYHTFKSIIHMNGHTCVPENLLINECRKLIYIDVDLIINEVHTMIDKGRLIPHNDMLYAPYMYDMERDVAVRLLALLAANQKGDI